MIDYGVKYRGTGFVVLLDPETDLDRARRFAPVLERMVEIMGAERAERGMTFGKAMALAAHQLRTPVPPDMEEPLLVSAFQVISGGRIPGAPDA